MGTLPWETMMGELRPEENCYQGDLWRMKMVKPFSYWSLEILKR